MQAHRNALRQADSKLPGLCLSGRSYYAPRYYAPACGDIVGNLWKIKSRPLRSVSSGNASTSMRSRIDALKVVMSIKSCLRPAPQQVACRLPRFRHLPDVRHTAGSMLSKKSFLADEQNFSAPLVGPMWGNVRDHIESQQNDHRPSYMPYRGLGRPRQLKPDLCEIFGAPQFSTFSTASTQPGHSCPARRAGMRFGSCRVVELAALS
jgi:hypothetical protein